MTTETDALDALRAAAEGRGRPGTIEDAIAGVVPDVVVLPGATGQVAAVMRAASERGLTVVPRGGGTKLDWGLPPETCDVLVDCSRLDRVIEHAAGDLICQAQAGVSLARLRDTLASAGQRLALEETMPGATLGGTVAAAASGPLRLGFGTPRDLLIGITVVLADGTVARSGGKVVKNVAGYDLGKLYCGSFGTLGIITEVVFRLHPLPKARAVVLGTATGPGDAVRLLTAVRRSQIVPSAIEVDWPGPDGAATVALLVEGVPQGVTIRASEVGSLLGGAASVAETLPDWWGCYPWENGGIGVRLTSRLSRFGDLLDAAVAQAHGAGLPLALRVSAGTGVAYAGLPGTVGPEAVAGWLTAMRVAAARYDGFVVVVKAPATLREVVDMWGPVRGLELMRRVKQQFDPQRRLAPGRFVGGI